MMRLLDMAYTFSNLDPNFITETLTRQIVVSFTTGGKLMDDVSYFTTIDKNNLD